MGSDITGYLEVKEKGKTHWKKVYRIPNGRCYNMFGLLNDFRNDINITPISKRGGFPRDLSIYVLNKISNDSDIVAPSYLYWKDFKKYDYNQSYNIPSGTIVIDEKTRKRKNVDRITPKEIIYKCGWRGFLFIMEKLAKSLGSTNVRIIFWYDN